MILTENEEYSDSSSDSFSSDESLIIESKSSDQNEELKGGIVLFLKPIGSQPEKEENIWKRPKTPEFDDKENMKWISSSPRRRSTPRGQSRPRRQSTPKRDFGQQISEFYKNVRFYQNSIRYDPRHYQNKSNNYKENPMILRMALTEFNPNSANTCVRTNTDSPESPEDTDNSNSDGFQMIQISIDSEGE